MFKRTIVAAATVFALVVSSQAQENATLVLRSGERVTGQLVDLGGVGFTVRVNGQERRIPTNDVSVIDFAGNGDVSEADLNRVSGGTQTVFLRNGQAIDGRLSDIGGTTPLRITLNTPSGPRDLSSSEIGRIVLSRPSGGGAGTSGSSPSTPGPGIPDGTGIAVQGNAAWTPTGVTVRRGDRVAFSATGEVRLSDDAADVANANGARSGRKSANAPVPAAAVGALLGRVGNSEPFPIGENQTVTMPANGQLFLGINDDHVGDNQGGFRVTVRRTNTRR
jgi:hypothetical protein